MLDAYIIDELRRREERRQEREQLELPRPSGSPPPSGPPATSRGGEAQAPRRVIIIEP